MTRRSFVVGLGAALALAACGPSAAQVKEAREARYQGTRDEVFLAVNQAVTAVGQKVERSDPEAAALMTKPRWYEKDGTFEDKALGSDQVQAEDGSILLAFVVRVVGEAPPFQVVVEPTAEQVRSGYSALYRFQPGDPQLPGWVLGKVDDLQLAVHRQLRVKLAAAPGTLAAPAAP